MGTTEQVMHTEAAAATGLVALLRRQSWLRWPGAFGLGALVGGLFGALVSALLIGGYFLFTEVDAVPSPIGRALVFVALVCGIWGAVLGGSLFIVARTCRVPYRCPVYGAASAGFMLGMIPLWLGSDSPFFFGLAFYLAIYGSLTGGAFWIAAVALWQEWQRRRAATVEEIAICAENDEAHLPLRDAVPKPRRIVGDILVQYVHGVAIGAGCAASVSWFLGSLSIVLRGFDLFDRGVIMMSAIWGAQLGGALFVLARGAHVQARRAVLGAVSGTLVLCFMGLLTDEFGIVLAGVFGSLLGGSIAVAWAAVRRPRAEVNPLTLQNLHKADAG